MTFLHVWLSVFEKTIWRWECDSDPVQRESRLSVCPSCGPSRISRGLFFEGKALIITVELASCAPVSLKVGRMNLGVSVDYRLPVYLCVVLWCHWNLISQLTLINSESKEDPIIFIEIINFYILSVCNTLIRYPSDIFKKYYRGFFWVFFYKLWYCKSFEPFWDPYQFCGWKVKVFR